MPIELVTELDIVIFPELVMVPELTTSLVAVTVIPAGIILLSETPGTMPPTHVDPVFQLPLCAAVNVRSGPIATVWRVDWCGAGMVRADESVMPFWNPVSADTKLNELVTVATSKMAITSKAGNFRVKENTTWC